MNKIADADSRYMARMDRQLPIVGRDGQRKIAETPIAIIGSGANGSLMALVCALVGFLTMHLFDPDKWEIHNLNRAVLAGVGDIGRYKPVVVKRRIESRYPRVKIRAHTKDIRAPGMWEQARKCRWVVDACDDNETREYLQKKCSEDDMQVISVACGPRMRGSRVVGAGCRANRAGHNDACLKCAAIPDGPAADNHVSLVVLNIIAVALGVDFLLRELTGYDSSSEQGSDDGKEGVDHSTSKSDDNFVLFDLFSRALTSERIVPSPRCPHCGESGK